MSHTWICHNHECFCSTQAHAWEFASKGDRQAAERHRQARPYLGIAGWLRNAMFREGHRVPPNPDGYDPELRPERTRTPIVRKCYHCETETAIHVDACTPQERAFSKWAELSVLSGRSSTVNEAKREYEAW